MGDCPNIPFFGGLCQWLQQHQPTSVGNPAMGGFPLTGGIFGSGGFTGEVQQSQQNPTPSDIKTAQDFANIPQGVGGAVTGGLNDLGTGIGLFGAGVVNGAAAALSSGSTGIRTDMLVIGGLIAVVLIVNG